MFTKSDISYKTIFVINCIEDRNLCVRNGELLLEETNPQKTLTKLPFQKILALFVIGHIHITTPLIDKCKRNNVALVVMTPSLRPVFYWANAAEANFLLRQKQYAFQKEDISIARNLVINKLKNQWNLLSSTRKKDPLTENAKTICQESIALIPHIDNYNQLLGIEGYAAKHFFSAYFQEWEWTGRKPRMKNDVLNTVLDIGYTILFNFIEVFIRMFGFDPYMGIYHRLWFKRKSLVCDLMEPFRCIVEKRIRKALHLKQIKKSDFICSHGEYRLKLQKNTEYSRLFYEILTEYKMEIFLYIQKYYRCFMQGKKENDYPVFTL